MSSKGETRDSHSAMHFNTFRNDRECSKQRSQPPSERQREENENPVILVNQASTVTLVEETMKEIIFSFHQCLNEGKKNN